MRIAFPHPAPDKGGPGTFQSRFEEEIKKRGWVVQYPESEIKPDVIMVVGGTRKLYWLANNKLRGVPIIYRLDGINWLHKKSKTSFKKWLTDELQNFLTQIKKSFLTDYIIFQSYFVRKWWEKEGWNSYANYSIIHNGVDLDLFKPNSEKNEPISLLCIEGNIDYSPYAIDLLNKLQKDLIEKSDYHSIIVYGGFQNKDNLRKLNDAIDYRGVVSREMLPYAYRNAVYLSLDVNAACPNTVIEAMASGIPVVGYDTGALKELVSDKAGEIASYGSDPWELEFPNVNNLCMACLKVIDNWSSYSHHARVRAEEKFDMNDVADRYIRVIKEISGRV